MKLVWFSWFSVFVCALALALFAYTSIQRSHDQAQLEELAVETNAALCAFKSNLEQRALDAEQYIADVQDGKREVIPGITIADLQRSLFNQQQTLDALEELSCE